MKAYVKKFLVPILLIGFVGIASGQTLGEDWQKPRKEPEVVREKEKGKPTPEQKKGDDRRSGERDEPKKKDDKKKP